MSVSLVLSSFRGLERAEHDVRRYFAVCIPDLFLIFSRTCMTVMELGFTFVLFLAWVCLGEVWADYIRGNVFVLFVPLHRNRFYDNNKNALNSRLTKGEATYCGFFRRGL